MAPPTHLAAVQQNARALRQRGDLAGARSMLEHALDIAGSAYDAADPDVLETARLLAALHRESGDLSAARRTLEETMAAAALRRPESDPLMLLLAYDLGDVADEFGNRHEARRNMATVARLGPASLGPDHPAVRGAERYLAAPVAGPAGTGPAGIGPAGIGPAGIGPAGIGPAGTGAGVPAGAGPTLTAPASTPPVGPRTAATRIPAHGPPRRGTRTVWIVVLVVIAVAGAAGAAVFGPWRGRPAAPPATAPAPTTSAAAPARPAPTEVRLRDDGSSITLAWQGPAGGAVPIIVAGGRAGEQSRPFAQLPAGLTTYTVNGLNPRLEYCFTIVAVYSTEQLVPSELVCTRRTGNPQPTRS